MPLERIPPHNLEAEQCLLGSILLEKEIMTRVIDRIAFEDFYHDIHRMIFEAMLHLYERHEPIDLLTLGNRLEEMGTLKQIGGRTALVELSNMVSTSGNAIHYAEIIQKKATLRRLLSAASQITELGFDENQDVDLVLDRAEQQLFTVSKKFLKTTFTDIKAILSGSFERIDELHREHGKLRGVPTGFVQLDHLLAGLQKSDLVILAARPSVGKTSLALDIARSVAVEAKIPVGIFSLEMSKEQLVDRMICAQAGIDVWRFRTGRLSEREDDFSRINHAFGVLAEAPIYIDDSPGINVMQLRSKARRLQSEQGLGLIVIDYLQLMQGRHRASNSDNRVQEISEISRSLKEIARELNIPVLALSQLSRAVEQSRPAIPKLSHLRDSGSIEQDADVVLFIYRKTADRNYREEDIPLEERRIAEIHIAKHRNGPTGLIRLFFDAERTSFRNLEMHRTNESPITHASAESLPVPEMTRSQLPPPPIEPIDLV